MTQPLPPVLLAALGTASLPHLLAGSLASRSEREAGTAMGWAVVLSMLLAAIGLMLASALPAAIDSGMPDLPRLLSPLSAVLTGLVVAGGLASLFALGQAALFSAAATLSHDLYDEVLDRRGTGGAAHLRCTYHRCRRRGERRRQWRSAGRLRRPTFCNGHLRSRLEASRRSFLGLWWRRCNEIGALGGMVAGFGFTGLIFAMAQEHYSDHACRQRLGRGRRAGSGSCWCALLRCRHNRTVACDPCAGEQRSEPKWRAAHP